MRNLTHTPLSRDRVLDSALRLADEQGLDALSMRKLASTLGVEAMSLYNHVPGKPALLSGMLERVLQKLEIPPDPDLPWPERLRRAGRSFFAVARAHPSFVQLLTSQHIHTGAVLAPTEVVLEIFQRAGFTRADAVYAYQAMVGYILGFILQQDTGTIGLSCCGQGTGQDTGQDTQCTHANGVHGASGASGAAGDHVGSTTAFDFGLDAVLAGLEATLRR